MTGRFRAEEIIIIIFRKYFQSLRTRGHQDLKFLDRVNSVFICFVASVICHCLKAWRTGELDGKLVEFKYQTALCKFKLDPFGGKLLKEVELGTFTRLEKTWAAHSPRIQELLLSNIKADISRRIASNIRLVEVEPIEPPPVEDELRFEAELQRELSHSLNRLKVPQFKHPRVHGYLRDSSVELAEPLQPAVGETDEDSLHGGEAVLEIEDIDNIDGVDEIPDSEIGRE